MLRSRNLALVVVLSSVLFVILVASGAPSLGVASPVPPARGIADQTSTPIECAAPATVDLTTPDTLTDSLRGGRTCRCSCGYPCKTDADCGGAIGSCRGGISCC